MLAALINIVLIILILGVLIAVHEFGHFIAAKLSRVQVDEFAVGMGPALFSRKYRGTQYSLRAFPIGGYVKILGEGDDPSQDLKKIENDPGNFQNKHPLLKIFILSAGVLMNLLTAVIIYYGFLFYSDFKFPIPEIDGYTPLFGNVEREVLEKKVKYELADQGGARDAGWPEKGYITAIGLSEDSLSEISYSEQFLKLVKSNRSQIILVSICHEDGSDCNLYETKISDQGLVGIYLPPNFIDLIVYEGWEKALGGFTHSTNVVHMGVVNIKQIFSEASESGDYDTAVNTVSSPIGLYFIVDFLREFGLLGILDLVANLSVTLFVMNLLPIPALDGGRIMLVATESLLGDAYSKNIEAWAIRISFILLMIFMLLIVIKDIVYWDTLKALFN